jgi:hypothetical protein
MPGSTQGRRPAPPTVDGRAGSQLDAQGTSCWGQATVPDGFALNGLRDRINALRRSIVNHIHVVQA